MVPVETCVATPQESYSEADARGVCRVLVDVASYIHGKGIVSPAKQIDELSRCVLFGDLKRLPPAVGGWKCRHGFFEMSCTNGCC